MKNECCGRNADDVNNKESNHNNMVFTKIKNYGRQTIGEGVRIPYSSAKTNRFPNLVYARAELSETEIDRTAKCSLKYRTESILDLEIVE